MGLSMQIIDSGALSAEENMQMDEILLDNLKDEPILHLYEWKEPSITYGYFLLPEQFINIENAKKHNISIARRPTGGGIVFHLWDLAFSFLLPSSHKEFSLNTLENYRFVNNIVLNAVKDFLNTKNPLDLTPADFLVQDHISSKFCMAKPSKYDVMLFNKKIAGAAQRKKKQGYLHQGTISLAYPDERVLKDLLDPQTIKAMFMHTHAPLEKGWQKEDLIAAREKMKSLLQRHMNDGVISQGIS